MKSHLRDLISHHAAIYFGVLLFHYVQFAFTVSTTDHVKSIHQKFKCPERTPHMNYDHHVRAGNALQAISKAPPSNCKLP